MYWVYQSGWGSLAWSQMTPSSCWQASGSSIIKQPHLVNKEITISFIRLTLQVHAWFNTSFKIHELTRILSLSSAIYTRYRSRYSSCKSRKVLSNALCTSSGAWLLHLRIIAVQSEYHEPVKRLFGVLNVFVNSALIYNWNSKWFCCFLLLSTGAGQGDSSLRH